MASLRFGITLVVLCIGLAASSDLPKEINILTEVGLPSTIPVGVSRVTGHHSNSTAFYFTGTTSHLISRQSGTDSARRVIETSHDFIVSAWVKVDSNAKFGKNTVLSISSPNGQQLYIFFAISSDWQASRLVIEFTFVSHTNLRTLRVKSQRRVDLTQWHKIAMRVQDNEKLIRFYLDDSMVDVQKFDYRLDAIPSNAQMRVAQVFEVIMEGTGEITSRFRGALQDVKILLGSAQGKCPSPTPQSPCQCPSIGGNECVMDGRVYTDGQQWNKDKCNVCRCKKGSVFCVHTCPVCKDNGKIRLHGDKWHPSNDSCLNCKCEEGKSTCSPPSCTKPDCNKSGYSGQTITLPGTCCPICKEDQCKASGREYSKCGCVKTCTNHHLKDPCGADKGGKCTEGCFCPKDKVLDTNGACVSPSTCTCSYNGKIFKPGQVHSPTPCKFCVCVLGYMHCSNMCF